MDCMVYYNSHVPPPEKKESEPWTCALILKAIKHLFFPFGGRS